MKLQYICRESELKKKIDLIKLRISNSFDLAWLSVLLIMATITSQSNLNKAKQSNSLVSYNNK